MQLFEVKDDGLHTGFRLNWIRGEVGVLMGYDDIHKTEAWLSVGSSIQKALAHPDDVSKPFTLKHAILDDKSIGVCLVAQTAVEADHDERALVLVDGITDPAVGVTSIDVAYGKPMPELVSYVQGHGCIRKLYWFKPGDALFISWPARALGTPHSKRFIVEWNGEALVESAAGRPRRTPRQQKKRQGPLGEQKQAAGFSKQVMEYRP